MATAASATPPALLARAGTLTTSLARGEPCPPRAVHAMIAELVALAGKDAPSARGAAVALGRLAPYAAAKMAGWPWRKAPPAPVFGGAALADAIAAITAVRPPWARAWLQAGLAGARSRARKALLDNALHGLEAPQEGAETILRQTLAQAGWAEADAAVGMALCESAVLIHQVSAKKPPGRRALRLQAMLVGQALQDVGTQRGLSLGTHAIGSRVSFDPVSHCADRDIRSGAAAVIIAPALLRGDIVLRKAVVAPAPAKRRRRKPSKT